jgi:hypothetical protein
MEISQLLSVPTGAKFGIKTIKDIEMEICHLLNVLMVTDIGIKMVFAQGWRDHFYTNWW